jgi:hypothetical protein
MLCNILMRVMDVVPEKEKARFTPGSIKLKGGLDETPCATG